MGYMKLQTHDLDNGGPKIVTICGSTRFRAEIAEANRMLTLAGYLVLAPGVFAHDGDEITEQQKEELGKLHFKKIDLARGIYVVNPGGYIGESTRREIEYARRSGKGVLALIDVGIDGWSPEAQSEAAAEMAVQRAAPGNAPSPAEVAGRADAARRGLTDSGPYTPEVRDA